ncbi:hypothetical protein [Salinifilum ghardaiensis]
MHGRWNRTRVIRGRTRAASRLGEHGAAAPPQHAHDPCVVCGRLLPDLGAAQAGERVCSAECARAWAARR